MASIYTFHHFNSVASVNHRHQHLHKPNLLFRNAHFSHIAPVQCNSLTVTSGKVLPSLTATRKCRPRKIRFAAEDTEVPEEEASAAPAAEASPDEAAPAVTAEESSSSVDQTVSVPVSPSDKLIMHFQAEGTLSESAISAVTKALEATEGISDLRVQVSEGIASVELTKETTIQATGVASSLVEVIQGSGFKLQTLNLSFDDDEPFVYA